MRYQASQFDFDPQDKVFSQEASMLQTRQVYGRLPSGTTGIMLDGAEFVFIGDDRDASGEDIYGWNFRATIGAVNVNPSFANARVLIVND